MKTKRLLAFLCLLILALTLAGLLATPSPPAKVSLVQVWGK